MRGTTIVGIILGLLLIFPGAEIVRFVLSEATGLYSDMTLTDAYLALIVFWLTVLVFRGVAESGPGDTKGLRILKPEEDADDADRRESGRQAPPSRDPTAGGRRSSQQQTSQRQPARRTRRPPRTPPPSGDSTRPRDGATGRTSRSSRTAKDSRTTRDGSRSRGDRTSRNTRPRSSRTSRRQQ